MTEVLEVKETEAMKEYANYAHNGLMEKHFGFLPHPDGVVVFSNQGNDNRVHRLLESLEDYGMTEYGWADCGLSFAALVQEEPDLGELWADACGLQFSDDE